MQKEDFLEAVKYLKVQLPQRVRLIVLYPNLPVNELYQQMLIRKSRVSFLFPPPPEAAAHHMHIAAWCVLCGLTPQGTGCTKKCIASIPAFTSHTLKLGWTVP